MVAFSVFPRSTVGCEAVPLNPLIVGGRIWGLVRPGAPREAHWGPTCSLLVKNRISHQIDGRQKDRSARNGAVVISIRHVPKRRRRWLAGTQQHVVEVLSRPPKTAWRGVLLVGGVLEGPGGLQAANLASAASLESLEASKPRRLEAATTCRRGPVGTRDWRGTGADWRGHGLGGLGSTQYRN